LVLGLREGRGKRDIRVTVLLPRARLLGQMGTDMHDIVGDNAQSDPALDAGGPFIE
jgi:hypothetical protein